MHRDLYNVKLLAEHWGVSDSLIYNEIKKGKLKAFSLGRNTIRIKREAVEEYELASIQAMEAELALRAEVGPGKSHPLGTIRTQREMDEIARDIRRR